jgi:hypothetical protein
MEVTEFVLARLAQREADLIEARIEDMPGWWAPDFWSREQGLAEVAAMRKIVDNVPWSMDESAEKGASAQYEFTLRILASVWSDHPDWREEWR